MRPEEFLNLQVCPGCYSCWIVLREILLQVFLCAFRKKLKWFAFIPHWSSSCNGRAFSFCLAA